MKRKRLLLPIVLGVEMLLFLALFWVMAGVSTSVVAGAADDLPGITPPELHVCPSGCTYASIQDAVDAAMTGAVIKVAAGTYTTATPRQTITQVVYISKTLSIVGGFSPSNWITPNAQVNPTIVDAQGQGRVFVISGSVTVHLENLRITGGDATGLGGGPWSYNGAGGGVYVQGATLFVQYCEIYDNIAAQAGWGGGGGLYGYDSVVYADYNTFRQNVANPATGIGDSGEGGGLALSGSVASLVGNDIYDNVAAYGAWGIGGGIYVESIGPVLDGNIVRDNVANANSYGAGGGIYIGPDADAELYNNVVMGNDCGPTGDSRGGGILVEIASPRLYHTTIHDNTGGDGSGITLFGFLPTNIALTDTILVSQTVGITAEAQHSATFDGVLWYGNESNTDGAGTFTVTHALTGQPAFAPDGYHLRLDSAALDAGQNSGVSIDVDGQARPAGPAYDLGADELVVMTDTVSPPAGASLVYTDPQGLTTTLQIPANAVTQALTLVYTPLPGPTHPLPPNRLSANRSFFLDAYVGLQRLPDFTFQKPVTVTIRYSNDDVSGLAESTLRLYYWTGLGWADATSTCSPPSSYDHDLAQNRLSVPICHLTEWNMGAAPLGGSSFKIYLPLVLRYTP